MIKAKARVTVGYQYTVPFYAEDPFENAGIDDTIYIVHTNRRKTKGCPNCIGLDRKKFVCKKCNNEGCVEDSKLQLSEMKIIGIVREVRETITIKGKTKEISSSYTFMNNDFVSGIIREGDEIWVEVMEKEALRFYDMMKKEGK